jgi:hypothetical protein
MCDKFTVDEKRKLLKILQRYDELQLTIAQKTGNMVQKVTKVSENGFKK